MDTQTFFQGRRVVVSGGTGFVGSHLLPLLVEQGAEVSVFCRNTSKTEHLPKGVKIIRGELTDSRSVESAIRGKDIFIHMAALLFGLRWQDYLRANCKAAQAISKAIKKAGDAGPSRIVLLSSLAASGPCASFPGCGDDSPSNPVSAYGWSKLLSENIIHGVAQSRLVTLRPPIIYGSGDLGLLPVYKGIRKGFAVTPGIKGSFPVSVIHVDDIAQAILLACKEKARGIYHLSDGNVYPMKEFYLAAAKAMGVSSHVIGLPLWLMGFTAVCSTALGVLCQHLGAHRVPSWNNDKFREAREEGWVADPSRICTELGFKAKMNLEQGMKETITGNQRLGLL